MLLPSLIAPETTTTTRSLASKHPHYVGIPLVDLPLPSTSHTKNLSPHSGNSRLRCSLLELAINIVSSY
ncbi:hypothetical protein RB195_014489 [Necator americanus]|uniref:Uncharacterized protein n=1 Tax=Necator americanus TaxID=51031 RepID=A0ABR1E0F0_NECAM